MMVEVNNVSKLNKKIIFSSVLKEIDYELDPHGEKMNLRAKAKGEIVIRDSSFESLKAEIVDNWGFKTKILIDREKASVEFEGKKSSAKLDFPVNADNIIKQKFSKIDFNKKLAVIESDIIDAVRELFDAISYDLHNDLSFDLYLVSAGLEFLRDIIYDGNTSLKVE